MDINGVLDRPRIMYARAVSSVDFYKIGVGRNLWTLDGRIKGLISIKRKIVEYIVVKI
jgi:hypothetical protein